MMMQFEKSVKIICSVSWGQASDAGQYANKWVGYLYELSRVAEFSIFMVMDKQTAVDGFLKIVRFSNETSLLFLTH